MYGEKSSRTIRNSYSNTFILAMEEPRSAETMAQKLSEEETLKPDKNFSYGVHEFRDGSSISKKIQKNKIILPAEIMNLEDLHFYVKLNGIAAVTKSCMEYKKFKKFHSSIEFKPFHFEEMKKKNIETNLAQAKGKISLHKWITIILQNQIIIYGKEMKILRKIL
jgi:type IV secretory pathway TraG/TraD family ATPase VirD4